MVLSNRDRSLAVNAWEGAPHAPSLNSKPMPRNTTTAVMRCLSIMLMATPPMLQCGYRAKKSGSGQEPAAKYPLMCNLYSLNKKRDVVARRLQQQCFLAPTGLAHQSHQCRC